ncbi:MAG: efflux RND transporter permease subunit [Halobacteriovoraceae bacterium]|nr:efflux RND transporter permease subunit [Halobacteriovoraceae bacterium]
MNIPSFSVKRPVTVICIFILSLIMGGISFNKTGVDLYPDVSFPIVSVTTFYTGASPTEIESLVTKPLEDDLSTLSGIKSVKSTNKEGVSSIVVEFTMETDIRFAEQKVKDRVSGIRYKLPDDIDEPIIKTFDPADTPIIVLTMSADIEDAQLYDLADKEIRPLLEQVNNVGLVEIIGGRKREIQVELNRNKLTQYEISATQISNRLSTVGKNIPAGKIKSELQESTIRTIGEFETLADIQKTIVSFFGNEVAVKLSDVAKVKDGLEDVKSKTYVNGQKALSLQVFKQSGSNTLEVAENIKKKAAELQEQFSQKVKGFDLSIVRDAGKPIKANVDDVKETILIGIILTVIVVFFFLGSFRSTIITGIAIPNSLIASFILMFWAGFTLNIMTLLAISLAIGLLIDDAIVVRENIFRHLEMGKNPMRAALEGTLEVESAVIATSLTILAVFGPIAFMDGMVSQFFKEFGLTICFIIIISTIDALGMAPMLSAYFAGKKERPNSLIFKPFNWMIDKFNIIQLGLEKIYEKLLKITLKIPKTVLFIALLICIGSFFVAAIVPKTFTPPQDTGEFVVTLELEPGVSLQKMNTLAIQVDETIRSFKEVNRTVVTVGGTSGETNQAEIFIQLVNYSQRKKNTTEFKNIIREAVSKYPEGSPKVLDGGGLGGAQQPFMVNIIGTNLDDIKKTADALYEKIKNHPDLQDVSTSSKEGSPEVQVEINRQKGEGLGISSNLVGMELRTLIEGTTPAVFRENGDEYNIRVRLQESDRDLKEGYSKILVPNINQRLVRLKDIASIKDVQGPSSILRQDRGRYITVSANIHSEGSGLAKPMQDVKNLFKSKEIMLPPGVRYEFYGQAENFQEMAENMGFAIILAIVLIFLVLSSLYESFITPFTIMLVIPLAACGAIYALGIFGSTLDLFSIIGCILLIGVATKNSILLIEYTEQLESEGMPIQEAIIKAGTVRLRPILMTAFSLIAGMLPLAIGLNEASSQRTSMGIAVIGGTITSTFLTLLVVPAVYQYIEKFKQWIHKKVISRIVTADQE